MAKFLLDSGDPQEYKIISQLAKDNGQELWGATTNPSLIAKKLQGQKVSFEDAFSKLQKNIVEEILSIVPGAVSAEVYSDELTTAEQMIDQGHEIATWGDRVVVKLPTTIEGLKARTILRKEGILINNTLVFSQQQIFAILLHEQILRNTEDIQAHSHGWQPFISPFVGRLDDKGENGMDLIANGIQLQEKYFADDTGWILESSIRNTTQVKKGIDLSVAMMTVRFSVLQEWFRLSEKEKNAIPSEPTESLTSVPLWTVPEDIISISSLEEFFTRVGDNSLDITHPLTASGIDAFVADWQRITTS